MLDSIRHLFITGEDDDGQIDDYQYGEQDRLQTVSFEMVKLRESGITASRGWSVCGVGQHDRMAEQTQKGPDYYL